MSYPSKENPNRRSWANPGPDMSGAIRIIAKIAANSVTTFKEREEASKKFYDLLVKAAQDHETWLLTHPSFSKEQHAALNKEGYEVIKLEGLNLKQIMNGEKIQGGWEKSIDFEKEVSMKTQVAIPQYWIGLRGTEEKTLKEQMKLFHTFKKVMEKKIPGVTAKMGRVVDYAEIEMKHKEKSYEKRGILYNYNNDYSRGNNGIRTLTELGNGNFALVTAPYTLYHEHLDLIVKSVGPKEKAGHLVIAPILVPTGIHYKGKNK